MKSIFSEAFGLVRSGIKRAKDIFRLLANGLNGTLVLWTFAFLYRILLDIMYIYAVSPIYSYGGLLYSPNAVKYTISIALYFLLFFLLPKREGDFISYFLNLQFAFSIAPMLTFYALSDQSTLYMLMVTACIILQIVVLRFNRPSKIMRVYIPEIAPYITIFLGLIVFLSIISLILYNGFAGVRVFDFEYLYLLREHLELPPVMGYLVTWSYSAIIPWGIIMMLQQKRYLFALFFCAAQLLFYICTGAKFAYLIIAVVLFVYFFARTGFLLKGVYLFLSIGCAFTSAFGGFVSHTSTYDAISTGLIKLYGIRALFIPASNKFFHYEFFKSHAFSFFSDGQIGNMLSLTYPYRDSLGRVIAAYSLDRPMGINSSNTGYLGEAYAQLGFIGMFLMSLLLALVIKLVMKRSHGLPFPVLAALFASSIIVLNDASLLTTLLSNGMFICVLLVIVYQSKADRPDQLIQEG